MKSRRRLMRRALDNVNARRRQVDENSPKFPLLKSKSTIRMGDSRLNLHNGSSEQSLTSGIFTSRSLQQLRMQRSQSKLRICFPTSPQMVTKKLSKSLSLQELKEIQNYKTIYYLGKTLNRTQSDINAFDDAQSDLIIRKGDQIAYRYEIREILGRGSFGIVVRGFDHKSKRNMALKIIKSQQKYQKQAALEIKVLKQLSSNENVVKIYNSFIFRQHPIIVFEILHLNFYQILKNNNFRGFQLQFIQNASIRILNVLDAAQQFQIIHTDVKPENLMLVSPNSDKVKIIDFGSSCYVQGQMYNYIQSRFYRAPEIIFRIKYTCAIDMWSFGCVLFELVAGRPLFPAQNEYQQIEYFTEILGPISEEMLEIAPKSQKYLHILKQRKMIKISSNPSYLLYKQYKRIYRKKNPYLFDLIRQCL